MTRALGRDGRELTVDGALRSVKDKKLSASFLLLMLRRVSKFAAAAQREKRCKTKEWSANPPPVRDALTWDGVWTCYSNQVQGIFFFESFASPSLSDLITLETPQQERSVLLSGNKRLLREG
jgi:hypothetical protein